MVAVDRFVKHYYYMDMQHILYKATKWHKKTYAKISVCFSLSREGN